MISPFQLSLNESWNFSALNEEQRFQLAEVTSLTEAECFLKMWFNFTDGDLTSGAFCNATWDNIYCWPPTPSGSSITRYCTEIFPEAQYSFRLEGKVTRICLKDGNWSRLRSNYKECTESLKSHLLIAEEDDALRLGVQYTLFIGSIISIICLGASLGIFFKFRCLRCDRVTVQAHLMISLSIRFLLMFIISEPHVLGHAVSYRDVDILCEFVLVGFLYSTFSSVSWMFIQGLYLNFTLTAGLINNIIHYHLLIYYIVGWGVPALFVFFYVVAMMLRKQERCWNGYSEMNEMWILLCPIMFEVVVTGIFLMNILRILLRKVRNSHSRPDASQIKAAAKATALLFPVLGISNFFLLYNPGGEYNKYFVALNTFFASTQGIFVSIVYCFTNKEVWGAIRRSFQRAQARRGFGCAGDSEHEFRVRNTRNEMIELTTRCQQMSLDTNCLEHEL